MTDQLESIRKETLRADFDRTQVAQPIARPGQATLINEKRRHARSAANRIARIDRIAARQKKMGSCQPAMIL